MVAWREMTSGDRGVSSAGLSFARSCATQAALDSVSARFSERWHDVKLVYIGWIGCRPRKKPQVSADKSVMKSQNNCVCLSQCILNTSIAFKTVTHMANCSHVTDVIHVSRLEGLDHLHCQPLLRHDCCFLCSVCSAMLLQRMIVQFLSYFDAVERCTAERNLEDEVDGCGNSATPAQIAGCDTSIIADPY